MKTTDKQRRNSENLRHWKKGQSGNPNGRPKKADCLTSLLREEIDKVAPEDAEGRTWKELLVIGTMRFALAGNATALKEIWERMDGKVTQPLGVDGADGMEVTFKIHTGNVNP